MWPRAIRSRLTTWTRRRFTAALAAIPSAGVVASLVPGRSPAAGAALTATEADTLGRVCWLLYPFPGLGNRPYARVVDALTMAASDESTADLVRAGIAGLDDGTPGSWLALGEAEQVTRLEAIQDGPFFRFVDSTTKPLLFNDRELWAHIGYEGSSLEFGGYIDHGLNDIDWLDDAGPR